MTKSEFIKAFCAHSRLTRTQFHGHMVALPCACDYEGCSGWAAVYNDAKRIKHHNTHFAPDLEKDR